MMATSAPPLVVVVDDELEVREFVCEILEGEGYRTRALESGQAALDLARTEPPALIVLDIYLFDVDGYTVASQLRALPATASIPIVFITGSDATVHQTLIRGLRAVAHLQKPFTAAQLLRAVGQALRGREG